MASAPFLLPFSWEHGPLCCNFIWLCWLTASFIVLAESSVCPFILKIHNLQPGVFSYFTIKFPPTFSLGFKLLLFGGLALISGWDCLKPRPAPAPQAEVPFSWVAVWIWTCFLRIFPGVPVGHLPCFQDVLSPEHFQEFPLSVDLFLPSLLPCLCWDSHHCQSLPLCLTCHKRFIGISCPIVLIIQKHLFALG